MSTTDIPGRPRWCKESRLAAVVWGHRARAQKRLDSISLDGERNWVARNELNIYLTWIDEDFAPLFEEVKE